MHRLRDAWRPGYHVRLRLIVKDMAAPLYDDKVHQDQDMKGTISIFMIAEQRGSDPRQKAALSQKSALKTGGLQFDEALETSGLQFEEAVKTKRGNHIGPKRLREPCKADKEIWEKPSPMRETLQNRAGRGVHQMTAPPSA